MGRREGKEVHTGLAWFGGTGFELFCDDSIWDHVNVSSDGKSGRVFFLLLE